MTELISTYKLHDNQIPKYNPECLWLVVVMLHDTILIL